MNVLDFTFYVGIAGIIVASVGICIGLWALCTKSGKKYMNNLNQRLRNKRSSGNDKNMGAKGG